jgi:hypothetical protein
LYIDMRAGDVASMIGTAFLYSMVIQRRLFADRSVIIANQRSRSARLQLDFVGAAGSRARAKAYTHIARLRCLDSLPPQGGQGGRQTTERARSDVNRASLALTDPRNCG